MRVGDARREVKSEVGMVIDVGVAEFDQTPSVLDKDVLQQDVIERRINRLLDVLNQDLKPVHHATSHYLHEVGFAEFKDLQLGTAFYVFNPPICLQLRIDQQWEPVAVRGDNPIVDGHGISGEFIQNPVTDGDRFTRDLSQGVVLGIRDVLLD